MKRFFIKLMFRVFSAFIIFPTVLFICASSSFAQEDETRFQAVDVQGKVMIYRDQMDETGRLHTGKFCDDGDKIMTDSKSRVLLRLKNRAYVYIAPRTKVVISKLRRGEKGQQIRLNLVRGRIMCQTDKALSPPLEMSAGKLLCRARGKLFEFKRKKETVQVVCFQGSVVTSARGKVNLVKESQLVKFEDGWFRYRISSLRAEEKGHLQDWNDRQDSIQQKKPGKK
jgi:hypothetical protein